MENRHIYRRLKIFLITVYSLFIFNDVAAKQLNRDSIIALNGERMSTNKKGMNVLGIWGLTNVAAGCIGYVSAGNPVWKDFHAMNAAWGVVNTGIAAMGLRGIRREMTQQLHCNDMLQRYESNKRLYLINAGLDCLYIGTGAFLWQHSYNVRSHVPLWRGFGRSVAMQGAFLLVFDSVMYASHQNKNKRWYKLMEGICFTENGIGLHYALN